MYVFVKKKDGTYYKSAVFGKIDYSTSDDRRFYETYFIILSEDKKNLIKFDQYDETIPFHLNPRITYIEYKDDFRPVSDKIMLASFLPDNILDLIDMGKVPAEVLDKCIAIDAAYPDKEFYQVTTYDEGQDLLWTSHGFHDAYIKEIKEYEDGLYLYFKGEWGCDIEMWFEGEVQYYLDEDRGPTGDNRWWYDSKIGIIDGFVFFCDDDYGEPDDIDVNDVWNWFKARNLKYRIIVDARVI